MPANYIERLIELIPELDLHATLTLPGRGDDGRFKTATSDIRKELARAQAANQSEGSITEIATTTPSQRKSVADRRTLETKLRKRWTALYMQAMESSIHCKIYRELLGTNPRTVKGEQQKLVIQVVGAIEEKLRHAKIDLPDILPARAKAYPNAEIVPEAGTVLDLTVLGTTHRISPLPYQEEAARAVLAICEAAAPLVASREIGAEI